MWGDETANMAIARHTSRSEANPVFGFCQPGEGKSEKEEEKREERSQNHDHHHHHQFRTFYP